MTTSLLPSPVPATVAAARVFLDAALREEGDALAAACQAGKTGGTGSPQRVETLRLVQAAHARSVTAICMLRALNNDAERIDAEKRIAHLPG